MSQDCVACLRIVWWECERGIDFKGCCLVLSFGEDECKTEQASLNKKLLQTPKSLGDENSEQHMTVSQAFLRKKPRLAQQTGGAFRSSAEQDQGRCRPAC